MAAGIGETLRATRRQQRLSLTEAAAEIRVREPYLAALEEEKFSKLGGDVYVRAFLRGYSEYLGLDPDQIVEAYRREHERVGAGPIGEPILPPEPPPTLPEAPAMPRWSEEDLDDDDDDLLDEDRPGSGLSRALVLAGVVLLLLVVTVVGLRSRTAGGEQAAGAPGETPAVTIPTPSITPAPSQVPDTPTQPPSAPALAETPAAAPPPAPPPPPPPADTEPLTALNVELRVTDGPSWLRATIDGTVRDVGTQPPGTVFTYQGTESVLLRLGDCSNVQLIVNGTERPMDCQDRELRDVTFRIGEAPSYGPTTGAPA